MAPSSSDSSANDITMEEPTFLAGPPRFSSNGQIDRTQRGRQSMSSQTGGRVHSFQLDGFTSMTNGDVPFMRVGPPGSVNVAPSGTDQLFINTPPAQAGAVDPIAANIDRMMNAAVAAVTGGANPQGFLNGHNILLQQQQQQQQQRRQATGQSALRNKIVYQLDCCYCQSLICGRAMRAILLADTKVELYSTDVPPSRLRLLDDDRMTQGCNCRIRDTACACCGNVLGYHVSQPCEKCLEARNNGHFWMFYSDTVVPSERPDPAGNGKPLYWGALSQASDLLDVGTGISKNGKPYECFCR